ncbi:MAG: nitroreductase family protein [bacterium]|nr:nitroreductase family protein [Gammaproteobacteria bacterium]HIL95125.1 nitroreductase family protein [Pseudomonadales bacterium]
MPQFDDNPRFFDLVGNVRSMRRLKPDPVPLTLLRQVLNAGVQASSGQNTQPWKFVVVREAANKQWFAQRYQAAIKSRFGAIDKIKDEDSPMGRQIKALCYQMDHMQDFPVLLLVCGERDWPFKVAEQDRVGLAPPNFGAVYPCVQNILLACRAVGLGAALTTMHQVFEDELHAHFEIPTEFGVVVTMPIGYPMGKFGTVRRKPVEEKTFSEKWGTPLWNDAPN